MRNTIVAGIAMLAVSSAFAANTKPGLWESTVQMTFGQGGPQIPPEQLEKMKQMGIQPPGSPHTYQYCVTPEMAARDTPPSSMRQQDQCKSQNINKSGNTVTMDVVCDGAMKGTGHIKVTYDSNASYSSAMDFSGTSKEGRPIEMHNKVSAKWLGDDCGSVKPPPMPAASK